jgi:uncharacterized membrane protein YjfL (UPF0719 family)
MKALRWPFGVTIAASLIIIAVALHLWGAEEVRADVAQVFFLTALGAVWLILATLVFSWFGISYRDDVVERRNVAALIALCGAILGVALLYAGGSLGEGDSYWDNIFSAGLGTAGVFGLWIVLELGAQVSRSIAEERDLASGLRLGGFLLAIGLVLGRATAGNWVSAMATVRDFFHDGWPAGVLCALALGIEKFARPSRQCPLPKWSNRGLFPALLYLALGAAWLRHLGAWEGMPE